MKEEKDVQEQEEMIICMVCGEQKPYYYEKKLFGKTYNVCKECAKQAREEGVANTVINAWFSDEDVNEGSVKAKKKLETMSDKKKKKLTKRLKKLGYTDDQIQQAISKIESGDISQ